MSCWPGAVHARAVEVGYLPAVELDDGFGLRERVARG
jgi:hypothetical protein